MLSCFLLQDIYILRCPVGKFIYIPYLDYKLFILPYNISCTFSKLIISNKKHIQSCIFIILLPSTEFYHNYNYILNCNFSTHTVLQNSLPALITTNISIAFISIIENRGYSNFYYMQLFITLQNLFHIFMQKLLFIVSRLMCGNLDLKSSIIMLWFSHLYCQNILPVSLCLTCGNYQMQLSITMPSSYIFYTYKICLLYSLVPDQNNCLFSNLPL